MTALNPFCSQCRHGNRAVHAEVQVTGTMNNRAYRANLCMPHYDMVTDNGAKIIVVKAFSGASTTAFELLAERLWEKYEHAKLFYGIDCHLTQRAHQSYIKIADRLSALGLNY
jgi:hypothetical protein